ncbi:GPI transamidase component PIG-T [Syncephalis fuscata]|nr:GPI transamidase component PIG-T [Syncephalis fuscata]
MKLFNSLDSILLLFYFVLVKADTFDEQLVIRPLEDGRVLTHFQFTISSSSDELSMHSHNRSHNYLFPPTMSQIVEEYGVEELRLSLTQGTWMANRWNYPVAGKESAGSGAELWAQLRVDHSPKTTGHSVDSVGSVDQRWRGLTHAMAGVFCASLNFIDKTHTVVPQLSFKRRANSELRYGLLPRESVCTENLTPWIKQLPCQSKTGLANLLNTHRIYKSNYHSMIVHIQRLNNGEMEIRQTVISVLEPTHRNSAEVGWSLWPSLERYLPTSCPLARQSRVILHLLGDHSGSPTVSPTELTNIGNDTMAIYDLVNDKRINTDIGFTRNTTYNAITVVKADPLITFHRRLAGNSTDHGSLVFEINNRAESSAEVSLLQVTPWYMKLFAHTLKIDSTDPSYIKQWHYQPAADRRRSTILELKLTIPALSTTRLVISFRKLFLRYTEYPPDANHGFDIGPAVLTVETFEEASHLEGARLYTTPFLLSSPLPDFSMPYNVITLTCTIIALFFGSMFNLLTRNFEPIRWRKRD